MAINSHHPPRKEVQHFDNGEPHFLTFSCYRRLQLLSKDRTRNWFVQALADARELHGFHLWAWVIMPDHIHVLLWPPFNLIGQNPGPSIQCGPNQGRIRGILSSLKLPVSKKAIAYLTEHAPAYLSNLEFRDADGKSHRFWQAGSGYDENVIETEALHAMIEYIHMNPVRRGLVDRPEQWKWSSARDWMGLEGSPILVDRTLPQLLEVPWTDFRAARGF